MRVINQLHLDPVKAIILVGIMINLHKHVRCLTMAAAKEIRITS